MCMYSVIGDDYARRFPERHPEFPIAPPYYPSTGTGNISIVPGVNQEDFDALKREVEELKLLLLAAKRFDAETGHPNCEVDEKVGFLRWVAEQVGVNLDEVFGPSQ